MTSAYLDAFVKHWAGPVKAIANVGYDSGELGFSGSLYSESSRDMQFFKRQTARSNVLCGRKTADSIRPTWRKDNKLLTGRVAFVATAGTVLACGQSPYASSTLWIIGGQSIYEQCLRYCSEVYLTVTRGKQRQADAWFPTAELRRDFQLQSASKAYSLAGGCTETFEYWARP